MPDSEAPDKMPPSDRLTVLARDMLVGSLELSGQVSIMSSPDPSVRSSSAYRPLPPDNLHLPCCTCVAVVVMDMHRTLGAWFLL